MVRDAQGCSGIVRDAQECPGMLRDAHGWSGVLRDDQECSGMLTKAQECSERERERESKGDTKKGQRRKNTREERREERPARSHPYTLKNLYHPNPRSPASGGHTGIFWYNFALGSPLKTRHAGELAATAVQRGFLQNMYLNRSPFCRSSASMSGCMVLCMS